MEYPARAFDAAHAENFWYDNEGRQTKRQTISGAYFKQEYDALGRKRASYVPDGSTLPYGVEEYVQAESNRYDALGQLATERGPFGTNVVNVGYDEQGRMTSVSYGSYSATYSIDGKGRITAMSAPEGGYSFSYLEDGFKRTQVVYPNGVKETRGYDSLTRMTNLVYKKWLTTLLSIDYRYDNGDRRTNEVWSTGRNLNCGYDRAHQLTDVTSPTRASDNATYRYDKAGNPIRRTEMGLGVTNTFNNLNQIVSGIWTGGAVTVAGAVNYAAGTVTVAGIKGTIYPDRTFDVTNVTVTAGTNILTAIYHGPGFTNTQMVATDKVTVVVGNSAYTHDANGNLSGDENFTYQYDLANRLTNVILKASNTSVLVASYDGLGRRIQVVHNGTTTERYVYLPGSFLVLAILDGSNAVKEFYTHGPDLSGTVGGAGGIGGILSVTTNITQSTARKYQHADAMGNVVIVSDPDGQQVAAYAYAPFGNLLNQVGDYRARFLFSSKELDAETGLINFGFRYLDVRRGTWLTRDPLEEMGGVNLYTFVLNSPLKKYDAHGLKPCCGADCTESLKQALLAANNRFDSHGWWGKFYGCFKMFVFPPSAATAWDLDFHGPRGTPPCQDTVTIGSTCYNKWDVNYALWGLGAKRCKLAFQAAKSEAWIYKIYKAVENYVRGTYTPGAGGTPDGIWEFSGTMSGWAKYGFDYPAGRYPSAQAAYGACEINSKSGRVTINQWPW